MKNIILFLLLSTKLFSQGIDSIEVSDTVYIYFDEKESYDDLHLKKYDNGTRQEFVYIFPDAKRLLMVTFIADRTNRKEKKCFLKKIKSKIITTATIHTQGFGNLLKDFNDRKKVIYLIDKNEQRGRKIFLRRAYCHTPLDIEM